MKRLKKVRGVAVIEFALGFLCFWAMCGFWFEISFISYVSSMCDVAIAYVAHTAKVNDNIEQDVLPLLKSAQEHSLWHYIYRPNTRDFYMKKRCYLSSNDFVHSITDLSKNNNDCNKEQYKLALYKITYRYTPIWGYMSIFLGKKNKKIIISREAIITNI